MLEEKLYQLLNDGAKEADTDWIEKLQEQHPTCIVPIALLLRDCGQSLDPEIRQKLSGNVLLATAEPIAMADLANLSQSDWTNFYPHIPFQRQRSTVDTIDTFLENYGNANPSDDALLERLIFNPVVPDYFTESGKTAMEEIEEPAPAAVSITSSPAQEATETEEPNDPDQIIRQQQTLPENVVPESREEPLLRESLAKFFIKQRRYERAFEIINDLSLKNPEKSAYFADQLRFLQKLINNQRFQQANAGGN